ncbi:NRT2 ribosyltransferase, partial [Calyptomena viridis]|nr:NRT2 ribosyltransferase [Calyptomena viridis]
SVPTMEPLPLLLVLLAGTLATGSPLRRPDFGGAIREIDLDMAPKCFDDQYRGCRTRMLKRLPLLNNTEFASNRIYAEVWANVSAQYQRVPGTRLRPDQAIALRAYTMDTELYKKFNRAVRVGGRSRREYLRKFNFKVLHFLITEALSALRKPNSCFHVYRGVRGIRFITQPGQIVRFGQFASSSPKKEVASKYGNDTFFEVDTCHGASIRAFSAFPEQEEVLIPPFETFFVTGVTRQGEKTLINLDSHGTHSKYNCEWVRGDIPGVGTPPVG